MNTNEMKDIDYSEARDLIEDAQEHMQAAIESLRSYVELTGDSHTKAYILDHLVIMTSADHGFLSREANLGDVLNRIREEQDWQRHAEAEEAEQPDYGPDDVGLISPGGGGISIYDAR